MIRICRSHEDESPLPQRRALCQGIVRYPVPASGYQLVALSPKLVDADVSPVKAVLRER